MSRNSSVDWDRDIYSKGEQLNHWPYSAVVSAFARLISRWGSDRQPKVLEVGSGAGNNLWLLEDLGFDVTGIEQSETAVEFSRRRLSGLGLSPRVEVGDMSNMPFEDEEFDFVLDRASVTQVEANNLPGVAREIHRVLRSPGSLFSFTLLGESHPDKRFGRMLPNGSYDFFEGGVFAAVGLTTFFSETSLRNLFREFDELSIVRRTEETNGVLASEEYDLVGRKF